MLVVNVQNFGEAVVLRCTGRIVAGEELATLKNAVFCHQDSRVIVLDLARVQTIDGAGMGLLAFLAGWTRLVGTKLQIINPSHHVREVLGLTNLDSVLEISTSDDVAEVLLHAMTPGDDLHHSAQPA